jgi:DNA-binding MarR family transcriptional regulator
MSKSPFDVNNQNRNTDYKIIAGLEKLSSVFRVLLWEQAKQFSLSPIQIQVLIFIQYHRADKATVSYLAKEFSVTKATISDAVKALEEKKMIKKNIDEADSRSYSIELTATGKKIVRATENFTAPFQEAITRTDATDKQLLWKIISQLIFQLNKMDLITVQRMCFTCRYYESAKGKHFCKLLKTELKMADIRIDCPEYEMSEEQ